MRFRCFLKTCIDFYGRSGTSFNANPSYKLYIWNPEYKQSVQRTSCWAFREPVPLLRNSFFRYFLSRWARIESMKVFIRVSSAIFRCISSNCSEQLSMTAIKLPMSFSYRLINSRIFERTQTMVVCAMIKPYWLFAIAWNLLVLLDYVFVYPFIISYI